MGQLLDLSTADTIESELGRGRPLGQASELERSSTTDGPATESAEVRLHDDATAAQLSKQLGAVAFTFGRDVFLAGDAPRLESPEGQHVLRHELTHVQQQGSSAGDRPTRLSAPNSHAEREAARVADGGSTPSSLAASAGVVHREVIEDYKTWIKKPLSRGWGDWAVTDAEALRVVGQLSSLSDGNLLDTYNQMQSDGFWNRLSEQVQSDPGSWIDLRWRLVGLGQPVLGKGSEDKRLAKLKSALSASERGFIVAADMLADDPAVRARLLKIAGGFKLASSTLTKGVELTKAATKIHRFSSAAAAFWSADLQSDAGAESVVALFKSIGEVGDLLPDGIWQVPFRVIGSAADVVSMVKRKKDAEDRIRPARRELREQMRKNWVR